MGFDLSNLVNTEAEISREQGGAGAVSASVVSGAALGATSLQTFQGRAAAAAALTKADVTGTGLAAADVGADASGAASTAQAASLQKSSNLSDLASALTARTNLGLGTAATTDASAYDAAGAASTEQTRALAAEALLAPKASPALTGTPTAPTATALDATTKLATTAYADAATAVEKTRAQAAEAVPTTSSGRMGITQQNRLVGGTSAGAPTTGTWQVGDVSVDATGVVWTCITAGTPGTWVIGGAGVELASADLSSDPSSIASTTAAAISGLSITFTAPSRPFVIEAVIPIVGLSSSAASFALSLKDGSSTQIGQAQSPAAGYSAFSSYYVASLAILVRLPRTGGANAYAITPGNSYTFQLYQALAYGGTGTAQIATASGQNRPLLRAVTC